MTPRRGEGRSATDRPTRRTNNLAAIVAPEDDTWAWQGIALADGRVISIAWLRGYRGAVASPARQVHRAA